MNSFSGIIRRRKGLKFHLEDPSRFLGVLTSYKLHKIISELEYRDHYFDTIAVEDNIFPPLI